MGKRKQSISNCYDDYFKTYSYLLFPGRIDWHWMKAIAVVESSLDPEAISPVGAIGVMQLMPETSAEMAGKHHIENAPYTPHLNINLGIAYARRCFNLWKKEKGIERLRFMLGSYNAGPRNIIDAQTLVETWGIPTDEWASIASALPEITGPFAKETIVYVARVESIFNTLTRGN
jgi:membrane-bound lytic murein transglycosylase F